MASGRNQPDFAPSTLSMLVEAHSALAKGVRWMAVMIDGNFPHQQTFQACLVVADARRRMLDATRPTHASMIMYALPQHQSKARNAPGTGHPPNGK